MRWGKNKIKKIWKENKERGGQKGKKEGFGMGGVDIVAGDSGRGCWKKKVKGLLEKKSWIGWFKENHLVCLVRQSDH